MLLNTLCKIDLKVKIISDKKFSNKITEIIKIELLKIVKNLFSF